MYQFKEARIAAHYTQKDAAAALGVAQPSVCDWESGRSNPTLANLVSMAALYDTTVDALLGADSISASQPMTGDKLRCFLIRVVLSMPENDLPLMASFADGLAAARGASPYSFLGLQSLEVSQ